MNEKIPSSISQDNPWIALGEDADTEDMLIGNKSGLLCLREAIDCAIEKGEYFISGAIGISGVRVVSSNPQEMQSETRWRDRACAFGCVAFFVICGGIFLFGCAQLISKLF